MFSAIDRAKIAFGACVILTALTMIFQLTFLPILLRKVEISRHVVKEKILGFEKTHKEIESDFGRNEGMIEWHSLEKRNVERVKCRVGKQGEQGPDGKDGKPGREGSRGRRGEDQRDQINLLEEKCIICPQGAQGPVGVPGLQGSPGEKGDSGYPGISGRDGKDGMIGEQGEPGLQGFRGRNGLAGNPGKAAPGGVGLPGPKGAPGPVGRAGLQGERGKRNYVWGVSGPPGQRGPRGLDGIPGSPGKRGNKGQPGERGSNPKFCPCPFEISLLHEKHPMPRVTQMSDISRAHETDLGLQPFPNHFPSSAHPPASPKSAHEFPRVSPPGEARRQHDNAMETPQNERDLLSEMRGTKTLVNTKTHNNNADFRNFDDEMKTQENFPKLVDFIDLPENLSEWRKEEKREKEDVLREEENEQILSTTEMRIENDYSSNEEPVETTKKSRFHYVTKRPRLYN